MYPYIVSVDVVATRDGIGIDEQVSGKCLSRCRRLLFNTHSLISIFLDNDTLGLGARE